MKKYLILIIAIIIQLNLMAGDGKSFIQLRSGLSIPLGKYSKNVLVEGSFTDLGMSFGLDGAWFFMKHLGVGADISYTIHTVDASALATAMVADDPFLSDAIVRSDPYNFLSISAGAYTYWMLGNKFSLQAKLLGGIMYGKTPFQLVEPEYFLVGPEYYKITSARDDGFVLKTGVSFNYHISNCIAIGLYGDYSYSALKFTFRRGVGTITYDKNISYLDFGLGLVIKL